MQSDKVTLLDEVADLQKHLGRKCPVCPCLEGDDPECTGALLASDGLVNAAYKEVISPGNGRAPHDRYDPVAAQSRTPKNHGYSGNAYATLTDCCALGKCNHSETGFRLWFRNRARSNLWERFSLLSTKNATALCQTGRKRPFVANELKYFLGNTTSLFPRKTAYHLLAIGRDAIPQGAILKQLNDRICEFPGSASHGKTSAIVGNLACIVQGVTYNHRNPARHGFENGKAEILSLGGQDEYVGVSQCFQLFRITESAGDRYFRANVLPRNPIQNALPE